MMNDASDEVYLAMPKDLKARGFLAMIDSRGDLIYIKYDDSGKRCYVVCSEWVRRGVTPSFVLNYIDEGIEKYGY